MFGNSSGPAAGKKTAKQVTGQNGEDDALAYLQRQGLTLVDRNVRCKTGEIDLIMRHGDTLVFVEVRKRANARYGGAAASVTYSKQMKLLRAAQFYLQRFRTPPACRFDVVAIDGEELNWIKSAITA
jgi:putative endonuclease